jgi:hypothetical protein
MIKALDLKRALANLPDEADVWLRLYVAPEGLDVDFISVAAEARGLVISGTAEFIDEDDEDEDAEDADD